MRGLAFRDLSFQTEAVARLRKENAQLRAELTQLHAHQQAPSSDNSHLPIGSYGSSRFNRFHEPSHLTPLFLKRESLLRGSLFEE